MNCPGQRECGGYKANRGSKCGVRLNRIELAGTATKSNNEIVRRWKLYSRDSARETNDNKYEGVNGGLLEASDFNLRKGQMTLSLCNLFTSESLERLREG